MIELNVESDDNVMDSLEEQVSIFMTKLCEGVVGCHVKCDSDGLITSTNLSVKDNIYNFQDIVGEDFDEFLTHVKFINKNGEEVRLVDCDYFEDEDVMQCVKYFMSDEIKRRVAQVTISREEYLKALLLDDVEDSLTSLIVSKIDGENDDIEYEDSLYADVDCADVAMAASPAFVESYIDDLKFRIATAIKGLAKFEDSEVAKANIVQLKKLLEQVNVAAPKEIVPEGSFDYFYDVIRNVVSEMRYVDFVNIGELTKLVLQKTNGYTYTLDEVAKELYDDIDEYTISNDRKKLFEIVKKYPGIINKNGIPYTMEDVCSYVELVSMFGFQDDKSTQMTDSDIKQI